MNTEEKLKQLILDSGLASMKDIDAAEKEAKSKGTAFEDELLNEGKISEDDLRRMRAYVFGIPYIDLKGQTLDFGILSMIPEPIARKHNIIAYKKADNGLEVAMLDINDLQAINFIKKKVKMNILPRLTDEESVKHALLQYQKSLKAEFGDIIEKGVKELRTIAEEEGGEVSEKDLKKLAEDLPVLRIVNALLNHAIIQGASDIHIEPMEGQLLVRYRIDGILHDAMVLPISTAPGVTARIKVLSGLKIDEKRLPQDGRFKIEMEGQKVSFRVST
ncbi:Flp pilus assembly complex ATPase component TadA, partial [bacterium]|nr:Flp pilus assembly complex ATPase component TadA [bacterium]